MAVAFKYEQQTSKPGITPQSIVSEHYSRIQHRTWAVCFAWTNLFFTLAPVANHFTRTPQSLDSGIIPSPLSLIEQDSGTSFDVEARSPWMPSSKATLDR